jgi:hypothetical protein
MLLLFLGLLAIEIARIMPGWMICGALEDLLSVLTRLYETGPEEQPRVEAP